MAASYLPPESVPGSTAPPSMAPQLDGATRAGMPIQALIVEDSMPISERLVDLISDPGKVNVAATATTEKEAIAACEAQVFDLAINGAASR